MAQTSPTVSVIIPCFQQAEYLSEALASVVAQTFADWEIVIVDDGSTDATAETARELIATYPDRDIRLMQQPNLGVSSARNNGIAASRGRYILPLDADDLLMPEMLEKTVGLLESDPWVSIAYTDQRHFGSVQQVEQTSEWDPDLQRRRNLFGPASLYRREVWAAVGGYNPNMTMGYEDWDFWIGAAERGFVGKRIPEPLIGYRVKASSRQVQAVQHHRQLVEQLKANHVEWFKDPWRRWRHWPRRVWRRLRHVTRATASGA